MTKVESNERKQLIEDIENRNAALNLGNTGVQQVFDSLITLDQMQKENQKKLQQQERREIEQQAKLNALAEQKAVQNEEKRKIFEGIESIKEKLKEPKKEKNTNIIFSTISWIFGISTGIVFAVLSFT